MEKEKQIEILRKIIEVHKEIEEEEKKIKSLSFEKFPKDPPVVRRESVEFEINKKEKFNWWIAILTFYFTVGIGTIIYYFLYKNKKKKMIDEEYNRQIDEYYKVSLPKYNEELNIWNEKHSSEIRNLNEKLNVKKIELQNLYSQLNLIPLQYRNIEAECYIYNMISTSNYSVMEAINNYDRNKSLLIEQQRLNEIREANKLAAEKNNIIDNQNRLISQQTEALIEENKIAQEQNRLSAQQNRTLNKMRKNNNLSNTIGIFQKHNSNKHLKGINKKL